MDDMLETAPAEKELSFREKWNRHVAEKKKSGTIKNADCLNRWVPYYFFFVLLGGVGWLVFAAVPAQHRRDPIWYLINEAFVIYVFIQVLTNWFLIRTTRSTYRPGFNDAFQVPIDDRESGARKDVDHSVVDEDSLMDSLEIGQDTMSYKVMVASAIVNGTVERKSFPYWSWVPCLMCETSRPPRCHHCTVCKECVLKRDHHCYFTRTCIGVNNQRYFLFFLFWCVVLTSLGICELVPYGLRRVIPVSSWWDLLVPVNIFHVVTGQLSVLHLHFIFVTWGVAAFVLISTGMFAITLYLALRGLTKFEFDHNIEVKDIRSIPSRLRAVLGRNWAFTLLLPGYCGSTLHEDAVSWPYIKV